MAENISLLANQTDGIDYFLVNRFEFFQDLFVG